MIHKLPWLLTKRGGKFAFKVAASLCVSIVGYQIAPHTIMMPYTRERRQASMEKVCGVCHLPDEFQKYVLKAQNDMKYTADQRKALNVVLAPSSQLGYYGSVNSIFGADVLLPWHMWSKYPKKDSEYTGSDEEQREIAKQLNESLDWSENGKLFVVAQELAWAKRRIYLTEGLISALMVGTTYASMYQCSKYVVKKTTKERAIVIITSIVGMFFYVLWALLTDLNKCAAEEEVIEEVCNLGVDYADGAVEIFSKKIQHNKAIRSFLGFMGRVMYTEDGKAKMMRHSSLNAEERLLLAQKCADALRQANSGVP